MRDELEKRRAEIKQAAIDKEAAENEKATGGRKNSLSSWFFVKETLASLGVAGFIIAFVVYYGTKASFDKASSEVGALNQKIGAEGVHIQQLEDQMAQLKLKADKQDELMQRLSKVDEVQLRSVLDQIDRPAFQDAVKSVRFEQELQGMKVFVVRFGYTYMHQMEGMLSKVEPQMVKLNPQFLEIFNKLKISMRDIDDAYAAAFPEAATQPAPQFPTKLMSKPPADVKK